MVRISFFFSFKQKTAYEMRISDWSSDVCSSDLRGSPSARRGSASPAAAPRRRQHGRSGAGPPRPSCAASHRGEPPIGVRGEVHRQGLGHRLDFHHLKRRAAAAGGAGEAARLGAPALFGGRGQGGGRTDRKSVASGKGVSGRVDPGGRRFIKKKTL